MMTYANDLPDLASDDALQADAEPASFDTVTLTADLVERARVLSQTVRPAERWQAYQNAIALFGFQHWLLAQGIDIADGLEQCSVYGGAIAGLLSGVCQLQVRDFSVCLLPIGSVTDDWIAIPRATLELEPYVPQLFIGLDVREECHQVRIWGSLRLDALRVNQATTPELSTDADWTYRVPRSWFTPDSSALLLYLRCLESAAIPFSPVTSASPQAIATFEANIPVLRHRLQSFERSLWKLLPWSQASLLLSHPHLAQALLSPAAPVSNSLASPLQETINVAQWLQGRLDDLARSLNWQLLPLLNVGLRGIEAANQTRSSIEQFEDVVSVLGSTELMIPSHAQGGCLDLPFGEHQVRLYTIAWDASTPDSPEEWAIVAILGLVPDTPPPASISLQICDESQVLYNQTVSEPTAESYLFSQVVGDWPERFWLTVDVANHESLTLPPFGFYPLDDALS